MNTKIILLAIMVIFFLMGCSPVLKNSKIVCRHEALSIASAAQENYQVRIAVGEWKEVNHVQPQIYLNGEWIFIGKAHNGHRLKIRVMEDFKVVEYISLERYFSILTGD